MEPIVTSERAGRKATIYQTHLDEGLLIVRMSGLGKVRFRAVCKSDPLNALAEATAIAYKWLEGG